MNCMNCGTRLADMDLDYCPHCGFNVLIQKKVDYLSKYYYNQGLEKASIRDLSGAITCLRQSLTYNKRNIQARNLLGLVYFETGEVVAALSEWVISKNLQSVKNLASEYIDKLQSNPNKLEAINETIKKYNHALTLCREGHEDMAAIQLKKILAQNSKLIKGYHLLALIQIRDKEWNKARRTLRRAARIDKTNTTTLRFLREVDEQTGVTTRLGDQKGGLFRSGGSHSREDDWSGEIAYMAVPRRERRKLPLFFTLMSGIAAGALGFWLLGVPAIKQGIYKEANQQIVKYSESLASQGAELSKVQGEAQQSGSTAEEAMQQIEVEKNRSASYEALLSAYSYMRNESYDEAAVTVQTVDVSLLSEAALPFYQAVRDTTGVSGINDPESDSEGGDGSYDDSGDYDDSGYEDSGSYDDGSDDYYDEGYEDDYYEDEYYE